MTRGQCYTEIAHVEGAALNLTQAVANEMALEDERALVKVEAIRRIMESAPNALTGKPHSASSAEAIVEQDAVYYEHRAKQRAAVCDVILMRGKYEAARLRARFAVELAAMDGIALELD